MNDLQEAGNVTQRAIDEMYDKEIITLQDFRTETENQVHYCMQIQNGGYIFKITDLINLWFC